MIKNLEQVNIIKRDKVKKGLEYIEKADTDKIIDKILLFGSCIRDDCEEKSDIDLCLDINVSVRDMRLFHIHAGIPEIMENECDILIYNLVPEGNFKEKIRKGVFVYENREY